jgi:hypothetical protein
VADNLDRSWVSVVTDREPDGWRECEVCGEPCDIHGICPHDDDPAHRRIEDDLWDEECEREGYE